MKKLLIIALAFTISAFTQEAPAAPAAQNAPAVDKPTWIWDGSNCEVSAKHSTKIWFGQGKTPLFKANDDGSFTSSGPATRYMTLEPGQWLVFEMLSSKHLATGKYHAWSLHFRKEGIGKLAGNVVTVPTGLYTMQLPDIKEKVNSSMNFYNYNMELTLKYIKMVKEPENYIGVEYEGGKDRIEVGDTFKVVLKLAEPSEDVTCKVMADIGTGISAYSINGKDNIELEAQDDDCKLWTATVTVKSLPPTTAKKRYGKRSVMLKASILGSKFSTPIYTYIPYAFGPAPEPKAPAKKAE